MLIKKGFTKSRIYSSIEFNSNVLRKINVITTSESTIFIPSKYAKIISCIPNKLSVNFYYEASYHF